MNVSSLFSGNFMNADVQNLGRRVQQFRKDFQQLGQDLQSGGLSAAQSDFATLLKDAPQLNSSTSLSQSSSSVAQAFQQLKDDLQSGNLSAAQPDFTNLQQDLQSQAAHGHPHYHHHHSNNGSSEISQLFSQLRQDLQSGDLASAQRAYTTLQQDLEQFALAHGALNTANSNPATSGPINTTA